MQVCVDARIPRLSAGLGRQLACGFDSRNRDAAWEEGLGLPDQYQSCAGDVVARAGTPRRFAAHDSVPMLRARSWCSCQRGQGVRLKTG